MTQRICVQAISSPGLDPSVGDNIADLLVATFSESDWVHHCDAAVLIDDCLDSRSRIRISGQFKGIANGVAFDFPIHCDYEIDDKVSLEMWIKAPYIAVVISLMRYWAKEETPKRAAGKWMTRSQFGIASTLESHINQIVGAPTEGVRSVWRNTKITGMLFFLVGALVVGLFAYWYPHPKNGTAETSRIIGGVLFGFVAGGIPAGLGGLFCGLAFVGRDAEDTVAGRNLMTIAGVSSARGLRIVSVFGAVICFALMAGALRLMFQYR